MLCEKILGKLNEFDTTGKSIEYVDIEWHEAFKRIHKKIPILVVKLVFVLMIVCLLVVYTKMM